MKLLNPERLTEVVDIGANPFEGGNPPYKHMLEAQLCNLTGFEPQEKAFAALKKQETIHQRYLPYAIGDGSQATLNVCVSSGLTSTLTPNPAVLKHFGVLNEWAKVIAKIPLKTMQLDHIDELKFIDYLSIDIQGGELKALQHGTKKLENCVAIHIEVSFIPIYENQPSFAEVDTELRHQGFVPHFFSNLKRWIISPFLINNNPSIPLNQTLEADIVYVKNIFEPDSLTDEQLKHLGLIMHCCYKSYDVTMRCIQLLEERGSLAKDSMKAYTQLLRKTAEIYV
jgi:FkbM family methyltransferase